MVTSSKRKTVEWMGGMVSLPTVVTDDGTPFKPEGLFWRDAGGKLIGHSIGGPGELLAMAGESLDEAIEHAKAERVPTPTRVRVASPALAEALRASHETLDVVCAPTPELDAALDMLASRIAADGAAAAAFFDEDPALVGAFFRAAAALYRAKPWNVVPDDHCVLSVSLDAFDVRGAVVSVIGQGGEDFGFVLFPDLDAFHAYAHAAYALERGESPTIPRHLSVNFERGADVPLEIRKRIAAERWVLAGPRAHPWLMAVEENGEARRPSSTEIVVAEAICRVVAAVVRDEQALLAAWHAAVPYERTLSVRTHAGEFEVTVRAPHEDAFDESVAEEEAEGEALLVASRALAERFEASPEYAGVSGKGHVRMLADLALRTLGALLVELRAGELRELVFETFPSHAIMPASQVPPLLAELRAFYRFAKREQRAPHADFCLRVLDASAEHRLASAFERPRGAGIGKAMRESPNRPGASAPRSGRPKTARADGNKRKSRR